MPTPKEILSDKRFQALPEPEKIKVLERVDPQFLKLPDNEKRNVIKAIPGNNLPAKRAGFYRGPKGQQPLYSVTPNPKEPLSSDFKGKFVAFNDRVNLEKLISPSTAEDVGAKMGWSTSTVSTTGETQATADDFDFDFED